MPCSSEACVASQSVDQRSSSAGGMGSRRRRGAGCGVDWGCCSPRREEMVREKRTLWWSEKLDVLMVGVAWEVSAALCGSWMAKWSIDDAEGWDTGLKEGGR